MLACPRCGSSYSRDQEFCGVDGERLADQPYDPLVGRTIDRYRIIGALGDGGMARVYRARHIYLEQDVAIKVLFGDVASDRSLARRFQREAQAASRIKHPNVVHTIDFGATPEGLIFMAMELLDGRTLSDVLRGEGAMPPERAAALVRQIAEGLSAAHALGFVHRDLKPKNVMLVGPPGRECLKILDFGLVLLTETDSGVEATNLTRQGQVFGTPAYMSPEQVAGHPVGDTADLYALGVILYQLLTGSVPFTGAAAQIAMHHLSTEPPPIPAFGGLGPLAMSLLAKDPRHRPQSAVEVIQAIDRIETARVVPLTRVVTPTRGAFRDPADRLPSRAEGPPLGELDLPRRPGSGSTPRPGSGSTPRPGSGSTPRPTAPLHEPVPSIPPLVVAADDEPAILSFFAQDSSLRTDVTREVGPELERAALGRRRNGWVAGVAVGVLAVGLGVGLYAELDAGPAVSASDPIASAETPAVHREVLDPPPPRTAPGSARAGSPGAAGAQARTAPTPAAAKPAASPTSAAPSGGPQASSPPQGPPAIALPGAEAKAVVPVEAPADPKADPPSGTTAPSPSDAQAGLDRGPPATRKDFERQDMHLAFALSRRGLNWRDLTSAAPDIAQIWGLWRIGAETPTLVALEHRASELEAAIMRVAIDSTLLEAKLERVRRALGDLPENKKGARHDALVQRYNSIRSRVLRARADEVKARLASEITVLEGDAELLGGIRTARAMPVDPRAEASVDTPPIEPATDDAESAIDFAESSTVTLTF